MQRSIFQALTAILFLTLTLAAQPKEKTKPVERFDGITLNVDSASTARFPNAVVYQDSLGRRFVKMIWEVGQDYMVGSTGTPFASMGAIPFSALTNEDLDYIIKEIRFIEAKNKRDKK